MLHCLLAKMDETKADEEMLAEIKAARKADREERIAWHEEMMAMIQAWRQTDTKDNGEETMACQETMEARLEVEEPASLSGHDT
jgi:hypothetical protein